MTLLEPGCRGTLTSALETVVERTQDFTDSAYTSHEHRENILLLCDRAKLELNTLLRIGNSMVSPALDLSRKEGTSLDGGGNAICSSDVVERASIYVPWKSVYTYIYIYILI